MNLEDRLKEQEDISQNSGINLENRINESQEGLENKLESFGSAMKKFTWWDWTKIIGVNAVGAVFSGGLLGFGALNIGATLASFVTANYLVNRKRGFSKNSLMTEFVLAGAYTPVIYKLFEYINVFTPNPLVWMGAYALALYPFTVIIHGMKHMIEKYDSSPLKYLKGILKGELFKDIAHIAKDAVTNAVKSSALAALFLTVPVAGSHYLLPDEYLISSLYPIRTSYRYILESREQKNAEREKALAPVQQMYPSNYAMPQAA